jgi:hypothetical protein
LVNTNWKAKAITTPATKATKNLGPLKAKAACSGVLMAEFTGACASQSLQLLSSSAISPLLKHDVYLIQYFVCVALV